MFLSASQPPPTPAPPPPPHHHHHITILPYSPCLLYPHVPLGRICYDLLQVRRKLSAYTVHNYNTHTPDHHHAC